MKLQQLKNAIFATERIPHMAGLAFKMPNWPLSFLREKLGDETKLHHKDGGVVIIYDVEDGRAAIFGKVRTDNIIEEGEVILLSS